MVWEAFAFDHLGRAVLDHLTRRGRDDNVPVVQRFDHPLESAECFREFQIHFHGQVRAVTLEERVGLFFQLNDDVARLSARLLITFTVKGELLIAFHTRIDMYLPRQVFKTSVHLLKKCSKADKILEGVVISQNSKAGHVVLQFDSLGIIND